MWELEERVPMLRGFEVKNIEGRLNPQGRDNYYHVIIARALAQPLLARAATAKLKLTFHLDHSAGADQ